MSEGLPGVPGRFGPGARIAGYLLEEQIGQGGMAVVFRAHDERLDRTVALKILSPALAADEAFRQRFIRESRAAAAVDDPHIIPVFEAGEAAGVLFIAMRYVRGGDARSLVGQAGPMSAPRAAEMISQVASALDAAHGRGLVHRDVKPANILLDAGGGAGRPDHVYLSDFGLSKGSLQASGLTGTGMFLGTLDYVAPEQIEGKPVDGRADEYSLACAAFELLAGTPPFARTEAMAVMYAQLSDPPPALTRHRPDLPAAADAVFTRALAKAPADRYPTCRDFAEALRTALRAEPRRATAAAQPPPTALAQITVPTMTAGIPAGTGGHGTADAPAAAGGPAATSGQDTTAGRGVPGGPAALAGEPVTTPHPATPGYLPRRRRLPVVLAGGAVLALIAVGAAVLLASPGSGKGKHHNQHHHRSALAARAAHCKPLVAPGHVRPAAYQPGPSFPAAGVVEGAAFAPDGTTLAIGDHDGHTYLWNIETASRVGTLNAPAGVKAVAFSCDNKLLSVGDASGSTEIWDPFGQALLGTLADPGGQAAFAVAFSPDSRILAAGDSNGTSYLWSIRTHQVIATLPDASPGGKGVQAISFSPDGRTVAAGDSNGTTYVWSTRTHKVIATLPDASPGGNGVQALTFSPDGSTLAAGDANGTTFLWSTSSWTLQGKLADNAPGGDGVVALAFSPDGATIATGDSNGTTYLWDASTGSLARTLQAPASGGFGVQALAFSPDGRILAVGDVNGITYLWQA